MHFRSRDDLMKFLFRLEEIGHGAQGVCYYNKKNKRVYKIFHQFFECYMRDFCVNYEEEEILKFKDAVNDTFIFADEVIYVADEVVGYITDYYNGRSLYEINPLFISLDKFSEDVKKVKLSMEQISNLGIMTYDLMYNVLYGKKGIKIIDTLDYSFSSLDSDEILKINNDNFNDEIFYFLVDGFFDDFIASNKILSEMYSSKDIDIVSFISLLRSKLSEYLGRNIVKLFDARCVLNDNNNEHKKYIRKLV